MARKSKLLAALDAHKGRDVQAEKEKKARKHAEKRAKTKAIVPTEDDSEDDEDEMNEDEDNGVAVSLEAIAENAATADLPEQDDNEDEDEVEDDAEDIPLSDLESLSGDEKEDIVPHQRLTINNTTALLKVYNSIATSRTARFSIHQSVTSAEQIEIEDVHDDLNRELAFYKQALDASVEARRLLIKEGVPYTRPNDYFAEMVKTDDHMEKIKSRLVSDAANKKASAEARKQRDLKKFGKQVQIAKQQERDKARKDTLNKINLLKRKRKGAELENPTEDDRFDVALEEGDEPRKSRDRDGGRSSKRQKKDAKFGFGGKKRFSKSGDAMSSGDMRGFSVNRMKGKSKGGTKRLGKSRRNKT